MKFLAFVLRVYSFVFHLALSGFLLGSAGISLFQHKSMGLSVLPFSDELALRDAFLLGSIGLICTLLAISRRFKFVFVLWTALAAYLVFKNYFVGPDPVYGTDKVGLAMLVTVGAVCAFLGAVWGSRARPHRGFF